MSASKLIPSAFQQLPFWDLLDYHHYILAALPSYLPNPPNPALYFPIHKNCQRTLNVRVMG
jgi:hypothetical protein